LSFDKMKYTAAVWHVHASPLRPSNSNDLNVSICSRNSTQPLCLRSLKVYLVAIAVARLL
jgi:hypothetical protein